MRQNITVEQDDPLERPVDPFVFDKSNKHVQALLKAGVAEERLKQLDADYREAAGKPSEIAVEPRSA